MESNGADHHTGPSAPNAVPKTGTRRTRSPDSDDKPRTARTGKSGKRRSRRGRAATRTALRIFLVLTLILGGLVGIGAFRLSRGPISLAVLKPALENAVSAELAGNSFLVRDAQLSMGADGLEIVLLDVRISEPNGAPLVQAPRAIVGLSGAAALSGRLGLSRVELVNPRLQFFYADDGTLSVKFAQPSDPAPTERGAEPAQRAPISDTPASASAEAGGPIDFVKAITSISAQARRREHVGAYLREIGLRQATLIVDNGRRKTIWHAPEIKIDLSHKASRSLIEGRAVINSLTGPWSLDFQAVEVAASQQLGILAKMTGVNPRGLSRLIPAMTTFEHLDVPLDGEARMELTSKGAVSAAHFELTARPGRVVAFANSQSPFAVEAGIIKGNYDPTASRLNISEASVSVDGNRLDVTGNVTKSPTPSSDGLPIWGFQFASTAGVLAPSTPDGQPVAIDQFSVRGQLVPDAGQLLLQEISLNAGGAAISAKGSINDLATDASRSAGIEARIAPMPLSRLIALWPSAIAPEARSWLATRVTRGQLTGGIVKLASSGDNRVSLSLEIGGTEILPLKGGPAFEIPRGLVRVEGGNLELTVPDATIGAEGKRLLLKGLRFTAVDTSDGTPPVGEVAFRLLGPLAAAIDIADREPLKLLRSRGITLQNPEGRLDGQIRLTLPLSEKLQASDVKAEGRLRLTDGRIRQAIGPHDVTGAKLDIEFSDTALDARGDFLVKGIPVKFTGQHFLNTTPDRQSPLRLNLKLDDADRSQLGLDINDLVAGDVPVEITVGPDAKGEYQARLNADLTKAELTLDAVAYRKPAGVQARVQFDPVKTAQGRVELRNFKMAGDTIAAEGIIILGADNKARELSFPDFSMNVVSRLEVQGKLRTDNIWEVRAKGSTFDGRELFRDLFNVQNQSKPVPKDKAGLDLSAEIDTVLGFSDTNLKNVRLTLQRRNDNGHEKTTSLDVTAKHETGKPFEARIRGAPGDRKLHATSQDAGQIFKAIGFYPNAAGGNMNLEVALDGRGAIERTGVLSAKHFAVFGDPIISEVFQNGDSSSGSSAPRRKVIRERVDFDWMELPFSVGCGQFVMNDVEIRGPLVGAIMRGKADFKSQRLQIGGTYIPLSGLNSALGGIPVLGQLLAGQKGEGILGITFKVQGPMSNPEVLVNPLSGILPGILRETQQLAPESYKITGCLAPATPPQRIDSTRASSAGPATAGRTPAAATPRAQPPDVLTDWKSEQKPKAKQ